MSRVVGVELGRDLARVVVRKSDPLELRWDPDRPSDLVRQLSERLGSVDGVVLSLGLAHLHPKHVTLPPAGLAERKRMLELEPDRFFPVQDQPLVVSLTDERDLAFAADAALVERAILAFEEWAPVRGVEGAPTSVARALLKSGVRGAFSLPATPDEMGLVEVDARGLVTARRLPPGAASPSADPLPALDGTSGDFLAARGAALGADARLEGMLVPRAHAERIRGRRSRALAGAAVLCAASVALALWSLDHARERALASVTAEVTVAATSAERAVALRDSLAALDREAAAIDQIGSGRTDPLVVLAALGTSLPPGATVLSARVSGDEWQIDGTAADAAALVPLLDRNARFQDVRALSASSRFQEGDRTYETFSIGFRGRPEN